MQEGKKTGGTTVESMCILIIVPLLLVVRGRGGDRRSTDCTNCNCLTNRIKQLQLAAD